MNSLRDNICNVRERIEKAALHAGRNPDDILLVAVTKTHPASVVQEAVKEGLVHFGENKVQEAAEKIPAVESGVHWHLIGHLQTNKVKKALSLFESIQSVDSLRLAAEISKRALQMGKRIPVLIEVNTSGEDSKYGISPADVLECFEQAASLKGIELQGLMTIGPFTGDLEDARPCFKQLARIKDEVIREGVPPQQFKYLSMGMTSDFEIAVEEGANIVRIGSAIFGYRSY